MPIPELGQPAPDFSLKGPAGQTVALADYRGHHPVVLVFYPLAFSPVCSHQLPQVEKDLPRFKALGAEVFGISVDSHWSNTAFAKSLGLTFPLLSDFHREAATHYGVLVSPKGYSGRALFVIGRDGRLIHREISENTGDLDQVPSNERALEALGRAGA
jgi:peroxiredoxin